MKSLKVELEQKNSDTSKTELEQVDSDAGQTELEQKNSDAGQTAKAQNDSLAPSKKRVQCHADGSEPKSGDQPKREPNVKDDAHHGKPKSSVRQNRSTGKGDYKSHPVYSDMMKVLKGANLPDRKYKMLKKELIKECETPLLP